MKNKHVMMVGSAEQSGGGVASVMRLIKKMHVWKKYECYWLGTQIQRNYIWKLWYAIKSAFMAPFIMWRYDIVHFHTVPDKICLIIQMPELLCAKLYGKKVIMHVHMGNQLNDHTENKLFKWCLNRSDAIVLLAKKWQELFKEKYADVKVPTTVVYNACDVMKNEVDDERNSTIIMAGYFDDNKAPNLLIEAWSKLKHKYPEWDLILMGNGDVERFKKMADDLHLGECISFPGYLTGDTKENVWRKASIFCLCSYHEGFPMVILEAWNYGIPVVTTPVGGLPDVIDEGKNCLTFPFGDSEKLACQLEMLIENEELRKTMSEYEKSFVRERFSLETVSKQLDLLYERL